MVAFIFQDMKLGIEEKNLVSKFGAELLSGLTKEEIVEKIKEMYKNENFTCELINGYAYDTTIEWLEKDNDIKVYDIDVNSKVLTGRNSNKGIFDMFDNVFEFTR